MILKRPNGTVIKDIDNILSVHQITVTPKSDQTGKIYMAITDQARIEGLL